MPKWISVEKAVIKYHIEKEAILLWVEMGQFPMLYIDNVPNVDEECILELFRRSKAGITAEYIDTLEQLCIDKTMVCEKYYFQQKHDDTTCTRRSQTRNELLE